MSFTSLQFFTFFPIVVLVYFIIPKKARYLWLLVASYYFYMGWNAIYALLIAFSTALTYMCGVLLYRVDVDAAEDENYGEEKKIRRKKMIVAGSLIVNLGILGFFKYFYFVLDNINFFAQHLNFGAVNAPFDIILPVGISFYTFQALGYTIDVYRGTIKAERNFFRYALFVSFFPQLVAGPIERSGNLLRQMREMDQIKVWNYERIVRGLMLMLWGYFMKMIIADRAAVLVNTVYGEYWMYGGVELLLASALFCIQIYCDFGSYSMIAIGAAKVMGFDLMENFITPFFSTSIKEIWTRWHVSLSTWMRDYVYIPLGGSRCSLARRCFNTMVTFVVSGLWHGANWTFVIWGALHGGFQVFEILTDEKKKKLQEKLGINTNVFSYKLLRILWVYALFTLAVVFFRSETIGQAFETLRLMVVRWDPWVLFDQSLYGLGLDMTEMHILLFGILVLFLVDLVRYNKGMMFDAYLMSQNMWFRWTVCIGMFVCIFVYGIYGPGFSAADFIYFQF